MRIALKIFYRKIEIRNAELIPDKGPMIICANHPMTFMDPLVIAASMKHRIFFLAKGVVFRSKIAQFILPKLNMIPVYRMQDDPSMLKKNDETFEKCYEHLETGGVILIFPEGVSLTERKLRKIKTGAARIALGAETRNEFKLGIKILNIGLNYQNPHQFNKDLFVNVDAPIDVSSFKDEYFADAFKAAHHLTDAIQHSLEKLIINIEDENTDQLVHRIEAVYKPKLLLEMGLHPGEQHENFNLTKNIVDTVKHYKQSDPARVERVAGMVDAYFKNLDRVDLSDSQIRHKNVTSGWLVRNVRALLFITLGFPIYVYGIINNYLPFEIPGRLAKRFAPDREYEGPFAMTFGIFTFTIFHGIQLALFWHFTHQLLFTMMYFISLPFAGFFAYYYWHRVMEIRSSWKLISLFYQRRTLISSLIEQRKEIIREFDKAREEYKERG